MKLAAIFTKITMGLIIADQQKLDELLTFQDFIHNLTDSSFENTQHLYLVS